MRYFKDLNAFAGIHRPIFIVKLSHGCPFSYRLQVRYICGIIVPYRKQILSPTVPDLCNSQYIRRVAADIKHSLSIQADVRAECGGHHLKCDKVMVL